MEHEQVLLGTVLIILAIGMAIFAVAKKPFACFVDYIIAFLGVLLVLYASVNLTQKPIESFTDNTSGIGRLLSVLSIKNSANVSSLTTPTTNTYNEDLTPYVRYLTLYYSCFSSSSYPHNSRKWYNIAPFFSSPQSVCPDVTMDDTNMFFLEAPSFSRDNGFGLGINKIIGPQCYRMGFYANDSFTIFFTIKFDSFSQSDKPFEILKLFANTASNNGISLQIEKEFSVNNELVSVKMNFTFGTSTWQLDMPSINKAYVYFFVIMKNNQGIKINVYPNIGDVSSTPSFVINALAVNTEANSDVLLSNKEMIINSQQNLQAHIYNFGVFNRAIQDHTISDLYLSIQTEIQKGNQLLQDLAATITNLQNQLANKGKCPYDNTTCAACSAVKDWTNVSSIILNATPECLQAINAYCTKNPSNNICSCWNPQNILSQTNQCRSYVSIFSGQSCVSPDTVDDTTLDVIKSKYNLCSCQETSSNPQPLQNKPIVVPSPKVIDNVYNYNADDVDLYNSIRVHATR